MYKKETDDEPSAAIGPLFSHAWTTCQRAWSQVTGATASNRHRSGEAQKIKNDTFDEANADMALSLPVADAPVYHRDHTSVDEKYPALLQIIDDHNRRCDPRQFTSLDTTSNGMTSVSVEEQFAESYNRLSNFLNGAPQER